MVQAVAEACLAGDAGKAVELVGELAAKGGDLNAFLFDLLDHLRSLLVVKLTPKAGEILGLAPEAVRELERRGADVEIPHVELTLRFLLDAEGEMRRASQPRYVLEMLLVRMAEARGLQSLGSLVRRLESLESRLGVAPDPPAAQPELFTAEEKTGLSDPPAATTGFQGRWDEVRRRIGSERRSLEVLLSEAEVALEGETLTLTFANGNHFSQSTLEDAEVRNLVASTVSAVFGRRLQVKYRFLPPSAGGPEEHPARSPGRTPPREHPLVRETLEMFGGRIVEGGEGGDVVSHRGEP
jgi:DNA polymerase-3 subunit gamma/tau